MIAFALALSILALIGSTWALWRAAAAVNHWLELAAYAKSVHQQSDLNMKQGETLKTGLDLALDRYESVSDRADLAMKVANDAFHAAKQNLQLVADYVAELKRLDAERKLIVGEARVD